MTTRPEPLPGHAIRTAEIVAIGSELTTGETRDTNGGELARVLASAGVSVRRILALPDDLGLVTSTLREALASVDLVVTTGGLGPTPDDLTREALAAAVDEEPRVDEELEAWLRTLFEQRGMHLPEVNLKQAWLIPSATAIPNPNGTAPGWWVDRPDGGVAVLLPGPPREMRPMWSDWVLPRLRAYGLGDGRLARTLRTYGIGESMIVERLGEEMLRRSNPIVATYARSDWLDVRISATDEPAAEGSPPRTATEIIDTTEAQVRGILGGHVWAEGETTWADLVTRATRRAAVRLATVEAGTHGTLGALLADVPTLRRAVAHGPEVPPDALASRLESAATEAATEATTEAGVALAAWGFEAGTEVRVAVCMPAVALSRTLELRLFQRGQHGRFRAAVAAAAFIVEVLEETVGPQAAGRSDR